MKLGYMKLKYQCIFFSIDAFNLQIKVGSPWHRNESAWPDAIATEML